MTEPIVRLDPGAVDGCPVHRTRSALTQFQERYGLTAIGELDPDTEKKVLAEAFSR